MDLSPFQIYLSILFVVLVVVASVIGRQILRTRNEELTYLNLQQNSSQEVQTSKLYEFASVQIQKRLYPQAIETLLKAKKGYSEEPPEAKALIENALGFSFAAQNNFKKAIKYYQSALNFVPEYPIALNNLGFAYEKLLEFDNAYEIYEKVILIEPKNKTAQKQIKSQN